MNDVSDVGGSGRGPILLQRRLLLLQLFHEPRIILSKNEEHNVLGWERSQMFTSGPCYYAIMIVEA